MLTRVFLLFWLCAFMVNGDDNVMTSEELEAYLKTNPNLWEVCFYWKVLVEDILS